METTIKNKWYIIPTLIIDRNKYKGRGRPKKTDYRIYPDKEKDFVKIPKLKGKIEIDTKDWVGVIGSNGI